jgi:hypothetical protein
VQPLLGEDVIHLAVQLGFTEELAGKESRAIQTLQAGAGRTGADHGALGVG